jgi:hypothetical protein
VRRRARAWALALAGAAAFAASPAAAEEDGAYDRLSGDLDLRAGVGAAFGRGAPSFAATGAAVYLATAGVYVHYADALGHASTPVGRSIATGVHVQPVFLARYATDGERGPAHLDLFLDSFAFELGAFWSAPQGKPLEEEPGVEIALAAGVPILPRSNGPWIDVRGALRWRSSDLRRPGVADALDRGCLLTLTLGWHQVARVHLVDAGDTVRR